MIRVYATCVAIDGRGVLIAGASGTGKSDLALRLIGRGAQLVSDDYTELSVHGSVLRASPPPAIAGKLEVRGLGILEFPFLEHCPVAIRVEAGVPERMPEAARWAMAGVMIPDFRLQLLEPSAALKVELALKGTA